MAPVARIFISHTSDMAAYPRDRSFVQAASDAVIKAGALPVDMAFFAAREERPADFCRRQVRDCDIFIGVIGFRYGSTVPDFADISYTELEFNEATVSGKTRMLFLLDEDATVPRRLVDVDGRRIERFRRRLRDSGLIVQTFATTGDLGEAILHALGDLRAGHAATAPVHKPWMVPAEMTPVIERPGVFAALLAALLADRAGPGAAITGLEGAGGFGKTTLAAHVCRDGRISGQFTGGLLWVTLGENVTEVEIANLINGLCETLTGQAPTLSDPMSAGAHLGRILDDAQPSLLVIDDVWRSTHLAPFLIGGRACQRLITTRIRDVLPSDTVTVRVDQMTRDEAAQTLTTRVPALPAGLVEELLRLTGCWPVLLGLVNASLIEHLAEGAGPEQAARWLIGRLQAGGPAALDVDDPDSRGRAVTATIAASLDFLRPDEQERYRDLAIFPVESEISADILALLWRRTGQVTAEAADRLREKIVRLRLASSVWQGTVPVLRLHETIRTYLRHLVRDDLAARNAALVDAGRALLTGWSGGAGPVPWWTLPVDRRYLWHHLAYHMQQAGLAAELAELTCDLRWVAAKIQVLGNAVPVESDLSLVDTAEAAALRRAIGRSAELLTPLWPEPALAATIASRLHGIPELAAVVQRYAAHVGRPRLENFWPSPDQPNSALLRTLRGHADWVRGCAFSPAGGLLATTSDDRTVRLWQAETGRLIHSLADHQGPVSGCAFSPDGRLLATASFDGTAKLWRVATGELVRTLTGHRTWVRAVSFSPDGRTLATAGEDHTVRVWRVDSGALESTLSGHTSAVTDCVFSPDGRRLASTGLDGTVRLWRPTGATAPDVLDGPGTAMLSCAFSPDGGTLAAVGEDQRLHLWSLADGAAVAIPTGHTAAISSCAFSPRADLLATASADRTVRLWRVGQPSADRAFTGASGQMSCCAFSPDGRLLAGASFDRRVYVWEPAAPSQRPAPVCGDWVRGCAFSPDGRLLATSSDDCTARLWDTVGGGLVLTLTGHTDWVRGCAFSPDGRLLATASEDRTARLWHTGTGELAAVLAPHGSWVSACAFSPDGEHLVTTDFDAAVRLWPVAGGGPPRRLSGHSAPVASCAFSADGALLATAGLDGTVRVWDLAGDGCRVLEVSPDWVTGCAFAPDGTLLLTTGEDQVIRVWEVATGRCLTALRVAGALSGGAWHPTDDLVGVVGRAGIYVLRYLRAA
jgi:WD40 repeat protein